MENKFLLYLDILGFTDMIEQLDENIELLNKVVNLFEPKKIISGKLSQPESNLNFIGSNTTLLSDTFLKSYSLEQKHLAETIVCDCIFIQLELLKMGFLTRGEITFGRIYHKDDLVFGKPLIKAYLNEKENRYPRVLIDAKTLELLIKTIDHDNLNVANDIQSLFIEDKDGKKYLNYINYFYRDIYFLYNLRSSSLAQRLSYRIACKEKLHSYSLIKTNQLKENKRASDKWNWLSEKLENMTQNSLPNFEWIYDIYIAMLHGCTLHALPIQASDGREHKWAKDI